MSRRGEWLFRLACLVVTAGVVVLLQWLTNGGLAGR